MGYMDVIRNLVRKIKGLTSATNQTNLQPKEILSKIFLELEKRKKLGIEESAYVPNVYAVYLNPLDYEELSPFLRGIRDQIRVKIMERVQRKEYRLLSGSVTIEIRKDPAIERNQVAVESSFLKEKEKETTSLPTDLPREKTVPDLKEAPPARSGPSQTNVLTRIVEEKKTRIIDNTKARLEVLEGGTPGDVIALKEGDYTFGRGREAAILLKDPDETISRVHFKLSVRESRVAIKDLNSTNGTRVNNIEIEEAELKKGDTISAGKVLMKVA